MHNSLSISHIAWPPDREEEMLCVVLEHGACQLEVAPLRTFGNPLLAQEREVRAKAEWYRERGFTIRSFQALLFGAEGVALFAEDAARLRMKEWLIAVGRVAGWCGAGPMVFGSPKNRLKGDLTHHEAMEVALPFFREVGDACAAAGSCLVMEANPEAYGADFCTRLDQAAELVQAVDSSGFRLHVDAGGLALSGENFEPVVHQSAALIAHVHASQPNLIGWESPDAVHGRLSKVLHEVKYQQGIAIEMRACEPYESGVVKALKTFCDVYGESIG